MNNIATTKGGTHAGVSDSPQTFIIVLTETSSCLCVIVSPREVVHVADQLVEAWE